LFVPKERLPSDVSKPFAQTSVPAEEMMLPLPAW
jgi:hypothetical protein